MDTPNNSIEEISIQPPRPLRLTTQAGHSLRIPIESVLYWMESSLTAETTIFVRGGNSIQVTASADDIEEQYLSIYTQ